MTRGRQSAQGVIIEKKKKRKRDAVYKDGGEEEERNRRKEIGRRETELLARLGQERDKTEGSRAGVTVKGKIGREVEKVDRDESLSPPLLPSSLLLLLLLLLCTRAGFDSDRRS